MEGRLQSSRIYKQIKGKSWNKILYILREHKDCTQERVAKELNVTRKTYRKYESGEWEPRIEQLIILSDFYEIPVSIIAGKYSYDQSFWKEIEKNEKDK